MYIHICTYVNVNKNESNETECHTTTGTDKTKQPRSGPEEIRAAVKAFTVSVAVTQMCPELLQPRTLFPATLK